MNLLMSNKMFDFSDDVIVFLASEAARALRGVAIPV